MTNILIDARLFGLEHAGIGRYVRGLLEHLPLESGFNITIIVHPSHLHDPVLKRFNKVSAKSHPYSYRSQVDLLKILYTQKPDLLHIPHFTISPLWPGKTVITIHDLIKHESRGPATTTHGSVFYWPKYLQYLTLVRLAVKISKHILVPSRFWKDRLMEKFHLPDNKITVTYEGVDKIFFASSSSKPKLKLKSPFILYVGSVYPHKNVQTILKAVKELDGQVHFYISCARTVFWDRISKLIHKLGVEKHVTHLGFVTDEELVGLYRNSLAFVTASKMEGQGLPGLEAMASGTAVISSNSSCLPEVYGNAALFFHPDDHHQLAQNISQLLENKKLRDKLIQKGKVHVKKYSWQKMADQTWEVYKQVLNK